ncbi:MAG: NAD(P)/FAD-dependent oxidoreductase [Bacteroidia bacterium]
MAKRALIIGGGAAGFFAAVNLKEQAPEMEVCILEKTQKFLSKVRVSGGGRCNVTHACFENSLLTGYYPRGSKELRGAFSRFNTGDTVEWFRERGVTLKTEEDGRMFPESNQSDTIINCLQGLADKLGVRIRTGSEVKNIKVLSSGFELALASGTSLNADFILIASGGSPKAEAYQWLKELGHTIQTPVPSLFTFNVPGNDLHNLMGLSVPDARISIENLNRISSGPLLITHWGFSGPAILKLSAWAARDLHALNYKFSIRISWIGDHTGDEIQTNLFKYRKEWNNKLVFNHPLYNMPKRLWEYLVEQSGIIPGLKWAEMTNINLQALKDRLCMDRYLVQGKTTFKEEFVTCGGVDLKEVDFRTMESRICPGLYFAGEVLDIDGVTGGFNFQSAWTTAWISAVSMAASRTEV